MKTEREHETTFTDQRVFSIASLATKSQGPDFNLETTKRDSTNDLNRRMAMIKAEQERQAAN
jgi:hypothetical protein